VVMVNLPQETVGAKVGLGLNAKELLEGVGVLRTESFC
jgi:hypothetical protein